MGLNSWNGNDDMIIPDRKIENFIIPGLKIDPNASPIMFKGRDGRINKVEGTILILCYIAYNIYLGMSLVNS